MRQIKMVFRRGGGKSAEVINGCGPSCKDLLDRLLVDQKILEGAQKPEYDTMIPEQENIKELS